MGKTPSYKAVQNLKKAGAKALFYVHFHNVILNFTEFQTSKN